MVIVTSSFTENSGLSILKLACCSCADKRKKEKKLKTYIIFFHCTVFWKKKGCKIVQPFLIIL